jgi:hypothetical protein
MPTHPKLKRALQDWELPNNTTCASANDWQ